MKRLVTAIVTAIEALAIVLAGYVVLAVPIALVWLTTVGFSGDPASLAGLVMGLWFFGHGVPLSLTLDAATSVAFGLAPEPLSFIVSLLPIGFSLLTVSLSARIGWRLASVDPKIALWGVFGGGLTFFALSLLLSSAAPRPLVSFGVFPAAMMPTLLSAFGIGVAYLIRSLRDDVEWVARLRHTIVSRVKTRWLWLLESCLMGLQMAAYALLTLTAATSLVFALTLGINYVDVVTLSQQLHVDGVGLLALFVANLAYLPSFLAWTFSWIVGPGFALGAGSSVSPLATELGPLPSIPILGMLPSGSNPWALGIVALVVISGLLATVGVLRRRNTELRDRPTLAGIAVSIAVLVVTTALSVAFVMALASGAIGPGRLAEVGPQPWSVAGFAALEVLIGSVVGVWLTYLDWSRLSAVSAASARELRETLARGASAVLPARARANSPTGTQEESENETVELTEFKPWWSEDEVR